MFNEAQGVSFVQYSGDTAELGPLAVAMLNAAPQAHLLLTKDFRVWLANPAYFRLFPAAPRQILGEPLHQLWDDGWDIQALERLGESIPGGRVTLKIQRRGADQRIISLSLITLDGGDWDGMILVVLEDVTAQEGLTARLIGNEELLEKLVDSLREGVLVLSSDLRVERANQSFCQMFQVTAQETLGRSYHELGNGQWDIPELNRLLQEVLPRQSSFDDFKVECEFEGIGWRRMSLNARRLDHMPLILLTIRDLTESHQEATRLQESEARFRSMTDDLPLLVWMHNAEGGQEYVNRTFRRFFELSETERSADSWIRLMHPEDGPQYAAAFLSATREQRPFHGEVRVGRDGDWRWLESWATPRMVDGVFIGMVGVSADVSERKAAEQALRNMTVNLEQLVAERTAKLKQAHQFRQQVLHSVPALVALTDRAGQLLGFNQACESATGYTEEQVAGRLSIYDLIPPEQRASVRQARERLWNGGGPFTHEHHWQHQDGGLVLIRWNGTVLRDETGHSRYILCAGADITEQREAQQQVRSHLEEAAWLQRVQTVNELATLLAHELKQPLATIAILADNGRPLAGSGAAEDQQELATKLDNIGQQARRADEIIRRLRRFVNQGQVDARPLDMAPVIADACRLAECKARRHRVRIETQAEADLPWVMGAKVQLEQVLLNLLNNAIEAIEDSGAASGRVDIAARREGDRIRVTVSDSGPGLDAEQADRLFEPLASTKKHGLGVGLRISRNLIEAHNGRLEVEIRKPGGVFHFTLPLAESAAGDEV